METLPKDTMLNFNPNTLYEVRELYNLEKPGKMKEAINILQEWIHQQNHLMKKDFTEGYLERTIISAKGSVEKSKQRLDKICTLRTITPNLFGNYNIKDDFQYLFHKVLLNSPMPKLTNDNDRIFFMKNIGKDYSNNVFSDFYKFFIIFSEYLRSYDYARGYIYVVDYTELNLMEFAKNMNPFELRQVLTILTEGYGVRINAIHILSSSKLVEMVVTIFKQVLSAKIGERIYVHKDLDSLHSVVPAENLPKEYGGQEKTLGELHDDWVDILSSKEHSTYMSEMNQATTNEKLRDNTLYDQQHLGVPGTFRTLCVD